jgi:hypothetical protein
VERLRWRDLTFWERLWLFVAALAVLVLAALALRAVVDRAEEGAREVAAAVQPAEPRGHEVPARLGEV